MKHLPSNHPVRFLIDSAANGRKITSKDLDLLTTANLPDGESLDVYRAAVDGAARRVAAIGETGDRLNASRLAEQEWGTIAARMTSEQAAIDTTDPEPESLHSIAARIFDN